MEIRKITREDEAKLPRFNTHREAKMFFAIKYGDDTSICYRYALILNREAYENGLRTLAQGSMTDADDFLKSYQSIEIMLNGTIHVIH